MSSIALPNVFPIDLWPNFDDIYTKNDAGFGNFFLLYRSWMYLTDNYGRELMLLKWLQETNTYFHFRGNFCYGIFSSCLCKRHFHVNAEWWEKKNFWSVNIMYMCCGICDVHHSNTLTICILMIFADISCCCPASVCAEKESKEWECERGWRIIFIVIESLFFWQSFKRLQTNWDWFDASSFW